LAYNSERHVILCVRAALFMENYLVVYVDDIVIIGYDAKDIADLKTFLQSQGNLLL